MKSKFKRNIRRRVRKLEEKGKISFSIVTNAENITNHLDNFFSIHSRTWKGDEKNYKFYYNIASVFNKMDMFAMYALCLNDRPISYMFGLKYKSGLYGIKTTYDPIYSEFSPGTYMFYKIVENACDSKDIEKFDIGRGDERYKRDLTCKPTEQIIYIAGHKKTIMSKIYNVRFKIILYLKNNLLLTKGIDLIKTVKKIGQRPRNYIFHKRKIQNQI
jgi:CelD/BcsL family acetyltransferase involved in cellulose biosynthesis